jgi:hypothetical protein
LENQIHELYSRDYLEDQKKKNQIRKRILIAFALLSLAVCIGLCFGITTRNAVSRKIAVMVCSTVSGWIFIYLYLYSYRQKKHEISHGESLDGQERKTVTGRVENAKQIVRLRNSITIRKLRVHTSDGVETVNICDSRSREVLNAGHPLKLYLSLGYVTAWEVVHEND